RHGAVPAPACDARPSCPASLSRSHDSAATTSPPTTPQRQTAPPPPGSSHRQPTPQPPVHADHWKEVGSCDAGPLSSQHLESQTAIRWNPNRFNQSMNRSSVKQRALKARRSARPPESGIAKALLTLLNRSIPLRRYLQPQSNKSVPNNISEFLRGMDFEAGYDGQMGTGVTADYDLPRARRDRDHLGWHLFALQRAAPAGLPRRTAPRK